MRAPRKSRLKLRYFQAGVIAGLYLIANAVLRSLRLILWPRRIPPDPRRICIYRIGFIGDTVVALPAIYAIRAAYPSAHLTLLTSPIEGRFPGASELLANDSLFDEVQVYFKSEVTGLRNRVAFLRSMRHKRFDLWFDLPQELGGPFHHLRNMLIARAVGAKWAYGFGFVTTIKLWVQAQSEYLTFPSEVEKLLAIVQRAGVPVSGEVRFPISLGAQERTTVDKLLGANVQPVVALAPGAKRKLSLWPTERFVTVGKYLLSKGFRVVILGGSADVQVCRTVEEGIAAEGTVNLAGRTSLKESCEVLKRCVVVVCNDSGVQHLASALGTPCVSIFSAHDMPNKWYPYGKENVVLRAWVDCHTCYRQTCPNDNKCLKLIEAAEVIGMLESRLVRFQTLKDVVSSNYLGAQLASASDRPARSHSREPIQ